MYRSLIALATGSLLSMGVWLNQEPDKISEVVEELVQLRLQLDQGAKELGKDHPKIVNLNGKVKSLKKLIDELTQLDRRSDARFEVQGTAMLTEQQVAQEVYRSAQQQSLIAQLQAALEAKVLTEQQVAQEVVGPAAQQKSVKAQREADTADTAEAMRLLTLYQQSLQSGATGQRLRLSQGLGSHPFRQSLQSGAYGQRVVRGVAPQTAITVQGLPTQQLNNTIPQERRNLSLDRMGVVRGKELSWFESSNQGQASEFEKLQKQWDDADSEKAKGKVAAKLRSLLEQSFEADLVDRQEQFEVLKKKLEELKGQITKREQNRDEILDVQTKVVEWQWDGIPFPGSTPTKFWSGNIPRQNLLNRELKMKLDPAAAGVDFMFEVDEVEVDEVDASEPPAVPAAPTIPTAGNVQGK